MTDAEFRKTLRRCSRANFGGHQSFFRAATTRSQNVRGVDAEIQVSLSVKCSSAKVPGLRPTKAKGTVAPEAEALLAAIAGDIAARAAAMGRSIERVTSTRMCEITFAPSPRPIPKPSSSRAASARKSR